MGEVFGKYRVSFAVLLVALIMVGELFFHHFELPAWPAFMVMVFFFLAHANPAEAKNILAGGAFGIVCAVLSRLTVENVGPALGDPFYAVLLFVAIFVTSIVLLKDAIPLLFNDYAFMFYLVSANIAKAAGVNLLAAAYPLTLLGVQLIGGTIFILGILLIKKILAPMAPEHHG